LLFWMIHALWALFGVSQWPARLLPVALSLLALWSSARLAGRLWPADTGVARLVPWLLFGSAFWLNFYTLVQFDLLLVLAVLGAWTGIWRARDGGAAGWLVVGLAIGAGVLAKGPVILVPVLPALLLAPWWQRQPPPGGWLRWYLGGSGAVLLGAAIALAWAVPAGYAGGERYREAIFWGQSAGRMVQSFAHRSPWWSYLLWLPLLWLPWLAWPAVWRACRGLSAADPGVRFCLAVLVPSLLVFSLISGKQPKYLLPLLPLLAMLTARGLAAPAASGQRFRLWTAGMLLAISGAALTSLALWPHAPTWLPPVHPAWGVFLLFGSVAFFRLRLPRVAAVRALALATALVTAVAYGAVIVPLAPQYRLQTLASRLAVLQQQGYSIAWLGKYHGQLQFLGRLREPLAALRKPGELRAWLALNPHGYVLVNYDDARPDVPEGLAVQPYRSGALVVWPAQRLLDEPRRLDALAGNA